MTVRWSRSYATGLVLIVLVALIWAASSVLIQYIYTSNDNDFHSPFLVTYIGVSLFTLWLPTQKLLALFSTTDSISENDGRQRIRRRRRRGLAQMAIGNSGSTNTSDETAYHNVQASSEHSDLDDAIVEMKNSGHDAKHDNRESMEKVGNGSIAGLKQTQSAHSNGTRLSEEVENGEALEDENVAGTENDDWEEYDDADVALNVPWTESDHLRVALYIAPVWFTANWTYNASLAYTSISSSTVLASTGSLFTFLFAVATADEAFSPIKLSGVLLGVVGSALTAQNDASSSATSNHGQSDGDDDDSGNAQRKLLGDVLGLISAVGYGTYAVQTRVLCPPDETLYSMQTLLGYIGLLNMIVLSPIAIYTVLSGTSHLGWVVVGFLVVKGLFDNVLSDYLWLRAVMLTNATTATVGLGLTIPLAFASDLLMGNNTNGNATISATQVCGALAVLFGFVLVNLGNTSGNGSADSALQSTHENDDDDDDRADGTHHPANFTDAAPSETEFVDSIPVMS